jgi:hypothetical protein
MRRVPGPNPPRPDHDILSSASASPSIPTTAESALRDLYLRWREGGGRPDVDEAYIATFDRARQTERLAGLFDRFAGSRS